MDKIVKYKSIIIKEIQFRASLNIDNAPDLKRRAIISESQTEFILLHVGWYKKKHIDSIIFHIEIVDDKIWIHQNNTDVDLSQKFVSKGIDQSDIILGFIPQFEQKTNTLLTD